MYNVTARWLLQYASINNLIIGSSYFVPLRKCLVLTSKILTSLFHHFITILYEYHNSLKSERSNMISLFCRYPSFHRFILNPICYSAQIFHTKEHKILKSSKPLISSLSSANYHRVYETRTFTTLIHVTLYFLFFKWRLCAIEHSFLKNEKEKKKEEKLFVKVDRMSSDDAQWWWCSFAKKIMRARQEVQKIRAKS